jgi:hypothetical protein
MMTIGVKGDPYRVTPEHVNLLRSPLTESM